MDSNPPKILQINVDIFKTILMLFSYNCSFQIYTKKYSDICVLYSYFSLFSLPFQRDKMWKMLLSIAIVLQQNLHAMH